VRSLPRQNSFCLAGPQWTVIYSGTTESLPEIEKIFFPEGAARTELGRVNVLSWKPALESWFASGADLVICELSRRHPVLPAAPVFFQVMPWINQVVPLPASLDHYLEGNSLKRARKGIRHAQANGFEWHISRNPADLAHFYHGMYTPYIQARHGNLDTALSYAEMQRDFSRSELILITQQGKVVGGALYTVQQERCISTAVGVLDADRALLDQHLTIFADWVTIQRGHQQGARSYDLGGSRPWQADGIFLYKTSWRPMVTPCKVITGFWNFMARSLPSALADHLNRLGLISYHGGRFYRVVVSTPKFDLPHEMAVALHQGLSGILVAENGRMRLYDHSR
jgi:hypothetical protein